MPKVITEDAASKATATKVITYILNKEKCCFNENKERVMSVYALDEDRSFSKQFKETAEIAGNDYGKDDRKYYHFKMTFNTADAIQNGGKVTPEMALEMAEKWHQEHFPDYQAVFVVQFHNNPKLDNEPHLHTHIVINASSFDIEKNKIDISDYELDRMKDTAYELGKEYGLEENYWRDEAAAKKDRRRAERENSPSQDKNFSADEQAAKEKYGRDFADKSKKESYRIAIDEAKTETGSIEGFREYLKENFNIKTKIEEDGTIKYKSPERRNYITGHSLGSLYELPAIEEALAQNKNKLADQQREMIEKEREYEWIPSQVEQEISDFRKSFDEFKAWKDNDYAAQREDWLKETEDKKAAEKEYWLNKTVLEQEQSAFYRTIEKIANDERTKSEMASFKEEMEGLKRQAEELQKQQDELEGYLARKAEEEEPEPAKPKESSAERDRQREEYVSALMTAGVALDEKIKAAEGLRDMNIEDGTEKSQEDRAYEHYGRDTRTFDIHSGQSYHSYQKRNDFVRDGLKAREDLIEICESHNIHTSAEFVSHLRSIEQLHKKAVADYNKVKKKVDLRQQLAHAISDCWHYRDAIYTYERMEEGPEKEKYAKKNRDILDPEKHKRDEELLAKHNLGTERQRIDYHSDYYEGGCDLYTKRLETLEGWVNSWKERYDTYYNSMKLMQRDEREIAIIGQEAHDYKVGTKMADQIESRRIPFLEDQLARSTNYYQTMVSITNNMKLSLADVVFDTERRHDYHKYLDKRAEAYERMHKYRDELKAAKQELKELRKEYKPEKPPRRSKAQAIKETNEQKAELRKWIDEAIKNVGENLSDNREANLKAFAEEMSKHGCMVRITENTISVKHPNSNQAIRTNHLGDEYTKGDIENGYESYQKNERERAEGGRAETADWRAVAAEAGRVDGSRTAQTDERSEGERAGEHSAQKDIDRVQRQVRGVAENVAQSVGGHRKDQQGAERRDQTEAPGSAADKQQVRTGPVKQRGRDER